MFASRYARAQMVRIWSQEQRLRYWFETELAAMSAMVSLGAAPPQAEAQMQRGTWSEKRRDEIEQKNQHEFLSFIEALSENLEPEAKRFLHYGLTSSDVLDTALALQLRDAIALLDHDLQALLSILAQRATEHMYTLCLGRTHGMAAEPTSFGLRLLSHYAAFARARERLEQGRKEICYCSLSGAVGNFAHTSLQLEALVATRLQLLPEPVATQVLPRDRHAFLFSMLAIVGSSVEGLATEIRLLQASGVAEVAEGFGEQQKGSSAMPHKQNPILCENLTGLARLVRTCVIPGLENVALWHERDMTHSSVERIMFPHSTITLDFALSRLSSVLANLRVRPEVMRRNVARAGTAIYSQTVLLALTDSGMSRAEAYRITQKAARKAAQDDEDFFSVVAADSDVPLSSTALRLLANPQKFLKRVPDVFRRVLGTPPQGTPPHKDFSPVREGAHGCRGAAKP